MRKFGFISALLLMGVLAWGCGKAEASTTIAVDTMICGMCVTTLETAFNGVDGVKIATADLDAKTVLVAFDDSKISVAAIEDVIVAAGYSANNKMANPMAYDNLAACCK